MGNITQMPKNNNSFLLTKFNAVILSYLTDKVKHFARYRRKSPHRKTLKLTQDKTCMSCRRLVKCRGYDGSYTFHTEAGCCRGQSA